MFMAPPSPFLFFLFVFFVFGQCRTWTLHKKGNGKDGLTRESARDHVPFRPRVLQPTLLSALSAFLSTKKKLVSRPIVIKALCRSWNKKSVTSVKFFNLGSKYIVSISASGSTTNITDKFWIDITDTKVPKNGTERSGWTSDFGKHS